MIVNALKLIITAVLVGLHLGSSEWLSFQFLGFVLVVVYAFVRSTVTIEDSLLLVFLVGFGFLMCFISGQDEHHFFVMLRFSVAAVVLFHLGFSVVPEKWTSFSLIISLKIAAAFNIILASLQLFDVLIFRTGFFSVPEEWFSIEYGTLLGDLKLNLLETDYFIRPSGFYSEPSALSAFCLVCIQVGIISKDRFLYLLGIFGVAVSASILGLIGVLVLHGPKIGKMLSNVESQLKLLIGFVVLTLAAFYFMFDRALDVIQGGDASTGIRLTVPIDVIIKSISELNFFGLAKIDIEKFIPNQFSGIFDNWILNQVMMFGVFGIFYVYIIFKIVPGGARVVWLMFFVLNGDPLYYDRVVIMAVLILIINSYANQNFELRKIENA